MADPQQDKTDKKDSTILVAIIGLIGVVAAALIAKIDFIVQPTEQTEVEEKKMTQQNESEKATTTSKSNSPRSPQNFKPIDNINPFQVCFENYDDGSLLKNYEIKFEGYRLRSKTDDSGCVTIPMEIISHEKSLSSYTVRVTLLNNSVNSEAVEIGLLQPSTYKINFKK